MQYVWHVNMNFLFNLLILFYFYSMYFLVFSSYDRYFDQFLYDYLMCRHGNDQFHVHFRLTRPLLFVGRWKWRGLWGKKWRERYSFPANVGIFSLSNDINKVLFPICTLTWRVNNYVSRQAKDINRREESTNYLFKIVLLLFSYC